MSRRVYLLGVGLALVALALALTDWALTPGTGPTEANARRIRPGMTLEEVEALLGGPAGLEYPLVEWSGRTPKRWQVERWGREWTGTAGRVVVSFGRDDRVEDSEFCPASPAPPGFLTRLRAWLDW
jgi:hypothetical protein